MSSKYLMAYFDTVRLSENPYTVKHVLFKYAEMYRQTSRFSDGVNAKMVNEVLYKIVWKIKHQTGKNNPDRFSEM